MNKTNSFSKKERLKGKTAFKNLVEKGNPAFVFPYKFYWKQQDSEQQYPINIGFAIPKRHIKKAVDRNTLRRRIKEVYRTKKHGLYELLDEKNVKIKLAVIYVGKKIISYDDINYKLPYCMNQLIKTIIKQAS